MRKTVHKQHSKRYKPTMINYNTEMTGNSVTVTKTYESGTEIAIREVGGFVEIQKDGETKVNIDAHDIDELIKNY